MIKRIIDTRYDLSLLVLRVLLGVVMLPHGAQKTLGWFGGHGYSATIASFTGNMNIPWIFAFLAITAESLGSLGLITGLLTRIAAFGVGVTMVTAALMVHLPNGFFMNWSGKQAGEGFEFHILAAAIALALMIGGGGAYSLDRALSKKN